MSLLPLDHGADAEQAPIATRRRAKKLYRLMRAARTIDEIELELIARGEAFFQVSGTGHEAVAALADHLGSQDYLHLHYRDKALMLARGMPAAAFFDNLLCTAQSQSAGRQMSAHPSAPELNIMSLVGPVGNQALQTVGVAHQIKSRDSRPLAVCALGDGTSQQGEVLEAIAEAVRATLPVLFLIEDNSLSISTRTPGKTFFSLPSGDSAQFYGLPIHRVDGADAMACDQMFGALAAAIRERRGPQICLMTTARLSNHTNADDETVYRDAEDISRLRASADPLLRLREKLRDLGVASAALDAIDQAASIEIRAAADLALERDAPRAVFDAKAAIPADLTRPQAERRGPEDDTTLPMAAALRATLAARMARDSRVTLYGEDIEDPKGDVFGLTRGLGDAFPGRVANSALSESTILGVSIGRALAGGRPVAFIQFADFLPLGFNQLAAELASLHWRSAGGWRAPVVALVSCGAYRPGLGPFHAASAEALIAHTPGLDVALPSTAREAAGMLNAAFASERPTVLLYPKALLNDMRRAGPAEVADLLTPVGTARRVRAGDALTMVGWGNTVPLCEKAADTLAKAGVFAEVIDLRWISPWDRDMVCASARRTGRLLVVHEDNVTAGFGAEVAATVAETVGTPVAMRRVARPDTFTPCHFGNQLEVLPSYRSVLTAAAELCGLDLVWEQTPAATDGRLVVETIGSSPADQTVELVEILVSVGDVVTAGQTIASLEADKAVVEIASPADGVVETVHLRLGAKADVGAPLITLAVARLRPRQPVREEHGLARLFPRPISPPAPAAAARSMRIAGLSAVEGRGRLTNRDLASRLKSLATPGRDGILQRTGIESRPVAEPDQTVVAMAAQAAQAALAQAGLAPRELSLILCSTSTPMMISPSTACLTLCALDPDAEVAAFDLSAACSGYIYGLAAAFDHLQHRPDGAVLLLTSESMRRVVDIDDPDASPIFGDAATATVLTGSAFAGRTLGAFRRPTISARGESGRTLAVPLPGPGAFVRMDGRRIFSEGVRRMGGALKQACTEAGLGVEELDLILPHQANGRLIDALRARLHLPADRVWNEIRFRGNTSSSSIPLALTTILAAPRPPRRIGLCAFGAGYTFGGAICETGE